MIIQEDLARNQFQLILNLPHLPKLKQNMN
jgi:hypothetical protein